MKKLFERILWVMAIAITCMAFAITTCKAQTIQTSAGAMAWPANEDLYYVNLGTHSLFIVTDKQAIDTLVESYAHVDMAEPFQVGVYILTCENIYEEGMGLELMYSIWLDERCKNQEGYPMYFDDVEKAKEHLKQCLLYDIHHDYYHEYDPQGYFLSGH